MVPAAVLPNSPIWFQLQECEPIRSFAVSPHKQKTRNLFFFVFLSIYKWLLDYLTDSNRHRQLRHWQLTELFAPSVYKSFIQLFIVKHLIELFNIPPTRNNLRNRITTIDYPFCLKIHLFFHSRKFLKFFYLFLIDSSSIDYSSLNGNISITTIPANAITTNIVKPSIKTLILIYIYILCF